MTEQRSDDKAQQLADLCERSGAYCGKGLLAEIEQLRGDNELWAGARVSWQRECDAERDRADRAGELADEYKDRTRKWREKAEAAEADLGRAEAEAERWRQSANATAALTEQNVIAWEKELADAKAERDSIVAQLTRSLTNERERREQAVASIAELAADAAEEIEHWGSYAGEFIQEKWQLTASVARFRAVAAAGQQTEPDGENR